MHPSQYDRRRTRVPPSSAAQDPNEAPIHSSAEAGEEISAQLDLAASFHAQAMAATDWEIANRGIRRGSEMLALVQRQLSYRTTFRGQEDPLEARYASLLAALERASALLRMRLARSGAASADPTAPV